MSTVEIILLVGVVVLVLVVVASALASRRSRSKKLQSQFGPEYDRTVDVTDSRREAEKELQQRQQRHDELDLRPLTPASRDRFAQGWEQAQARFVDDPRGALSQADELVQQAMSERGYPTGDFDEQAADLSVEHSSVLDHYRDAHELNRLSGRGEASTEDMRQGIVHYRVLFAQLLSDTRSEQQS